MDKLNIASYNINGIRAAMRKGLVDWLRENPLDIVCFQEIKANPEQFDVGEFEELGYHCYWNPAEKKGYSGTAILTKLKPDHVEIGMGKPKYDSEGRIMRMDYKDLSIISAYFPSGSSGDVRQAFKMEFLDDIYDYLQALIKEKPNLILCGDYNICNKAIDIHNPVSNKNTSGFKPEEREWMDKLFENGFIDVFRHFNKEPHHYSWWSYRANARANNKGWRIDYCSATNPLKERLTGAAIFSEAYHSDHCPVYMQMKM